MGGDGLTIRLVTDSLSLFYHKLREKQTQITAGDIRDRKLSGSELRAKTAKSRSEMALARRKDGGSARAGWRWLRLLLLPGAR